MAKSDFALQGRHRATGWSVGTGRQFRHVASPFVPGSWKAGDPDRVSRKTVLATGLDRCGGSECQCRDVARPPLLSNRHVKTVPLCWGHDKVMLRNVQKVWNNRKKSMIVDAILELWAPTFHGKAAAYLETLHRYQSKGAEARHYWVMRTQNDTWVERWRPHVLNCSNGLANELYKIRDHLAGFILL